MNNGGSNGDYCINNLTINSDKMFKGGLSTSVIKGDFKHTLNDKTYTMNFNNKKINTIEIDLVDNLYKTLDFKKQFITAYKIDLINCDFNSITGIFHRIGANNGVNLKPNDLTLNYLTTNEKGIGIGSDYKTNYDLTQGFLISCNGITNLTGTNKKIRIIYEYVNIITNKLRR